MKFSRKFSLSILVILLSAMLCWFKHIDGSNWVWIAGLVLGSHHAANVVDKKLGGAG